MSVAFRRESDEEHLEPKFELPIPAGPNLVTAQGLALIQDRIAALEAELMGAADEAAIATLKRDLRYWHTRQITAEQVPIPAGDRVEIGVRVSVLLNGATRMFELVGDDQADPAAGLISFSSPLARAMAGAEVGDMLPFNGIADGLEILEIEVVGK